MYESNTHVIKYGRCDGMRQTANTEPIELDECVVHTDYRLRIHSHDHDTRAWMQKDILHLKFCLMEHNYCKINYKIYNMVFKCNNLYHKFLTSIKYFTTDWTRENSHGSCECVFALVCVCVCECVRQSDNERISSQPILSDVCATTYLYFRLLQICGACHVSCHVLPRFLSPPPISHSLASLFLLVCSYLQCVILFAKVIYWRSCWISVYARGARIRMCWCEYVQMKCWIRICIHTVILTHSRIWLWWANDTVVDSVNAVYSALSVAEMGTMNRYLT